jgi:predicted SprT family Zn-dependent metalloprotease
MNLRAAENLAFELLLKHNLRCKETLRDFQGNVVKQWRFEFDSSRRRFGLCRHGSQIISLSESITLLNDEATVRDTILHEIAHALVGDGHGHDETWKCKCREIGAKPERCYDGDDVVTPPAPFEATCPGCGTLHERHRQPKEGRKISCGLCSRGRYNERFRLMWHRHGTPQPPLPQAAQAQPYLKGIQARLNLQRISDRQEMLNDWTYIFNVNERLAN